MAVTTYQHDANDIFSNPEADRVPWEELFEFLEAQRCNKVITENINQTHVSTQAKKM